MVVVRIFSFFIYGVKYIRIFFLGMCVFLVGEKVFGVGIGEFVLFIESVFFISF